MLHSKWRTDEQRDGRKDEQPYGQGQIYITDKNMLMDVQTDGQTLDSEFSQYLILSTYSGELKGRYAGKSVIVKLS